MNEPTVWFYATDDEGDWSAQNDGFRVHADSFQELKDTVTEFSDTRLVYLIKDSGLRWVPIDWQSYAWQYPNYDVLVTDEAAVGNADIRHAKGGPGSESWLSKLADLTERDLDQLMEETMEKIS